MRGGTRRPGTGTRATQASLRVRRRFPSVMIKNLPLKDNPSPAPTGTKRLPRRHHKKPTREGGGGFTQVSFSGQIVKFVGAGVVWMWGGDACVALAGGLSP